MSEKSGAIPSSANAGIDGPGDARCTGGAPAQPPFEVYAKILDKIRQGLCVYDSEQRLLLFNRRYAEMYGIAPECLRLGMTLREVIDLRYAAGTGPAMTPAHYAAWRDRIQVADRVVETVVELRNGSVHEIHHEPMPEGGWVATFDDITERRRAEQALLDQQQRLDAALANMPHGLCMFDAGKRLIICNRRYAEMYALPEHLTRPGTPLQQILTHRVATGCAPVDMESYAHGLPLALKGQTGEFRTELADGRIVQISYRPVACGAYVSTHQDITAAIRAESRIHHLARHDALTDLPNRVLFRERLNEALKRARRGESLALLWLDLDHFKPVNDGLGHATGDLVLREVADRLRGCVRELDTVARLGGDEFAVVQVAAEQPAGARALASRIAQRLAAPMDIQGRRLRVGASIGVAVAPTDGVEPDGLLRNADLALYRAKDEGRGIVRFFEPAMDGRMRARQRLEADLQMALAKGEFEILYQPWCNLRTGEAVGCEALLRWRHPERGHIDRVEFIPVAEETGLILPLGAWVLRQACKDAAEWGGAKLAVNISPIQFRDDGLMGAVASALSLSGLPPHLLELEITETCLLHDNDATTATLRRLRALGPRIVMDDFGTGYSSLSYIRRFPFGKIKIDRSFVRGVLDNRESAAIVRAVIGLGNALEIATTAEGVETQEQLDWLRAERCTEAQGFFLGRPSSAREMTRLFAQPAQRIGAGR